jgi:hypothetical protein
MTGPRHHRDHYPVLLARDPRRVRLKEAERRPEIQRLPASPSLAQVIARTATPAMRAAIALSEPRPDRDHDRTVGGDLDRFHDRLAQPQQPGPYSFVAHAATRPFRGFLTLRSRNPRSTAACAPLARRSGASSAPTSLPPSADGGGCQPARNRCKPRQRLATGAPVERWLTDDDDRATYAIALSLHPRKQQKRPKWLDSRRVSL